MPWKPPKTELFYKLLAMRKKKNQPPDEESGDDAYTLSDASPQLGSPSPSYSPPPLTPQHHHPPQGPLTATETTVSPALVADFAPQRLHDERTGLNALEGDSASRMPYRDTFGRKLEPLLRDLRQHMENVKSAVDQLGKTHKKIMMLAESPVTPSLSPPSNAPPPPVPSDTVRVPLPLPEENVKCVNHVNCGARKEKDFLASCFGCKRWFCVACGEYDPDVIKQIAPGEGGFYCVSCGTPNTPLHAPARQRGAARLEQKKGKHLKRLQTSKRL